MALHHVNEIPLGILTQRRLAEMRVVRQEVRRLGVHIGEVTTASSRHQYFSSDFTRVLNQQNGQSSLATDQCAHQTGGASTNDHYIVRLLQNQALNLDNTNGDAA